jgi:hypothetical protein
MSQQLSPTPVAQTSNLALVSLIAGIASWVIAPFLGAIIAVITGHMAKNEIRRSAGLLTGDGLATAGLVLGYVQIGLSVIGICVAGAMIALGITAPLMCLPFVNEFSMLLGG